MPVTRSFNSAATGLSALRAGGGGGGSRSCSSSSIFSTGGSSGTRGNWSSRASSTHAFKSAASYAGSSGQPYSSGSSSDDRSGSSSSSSGRDTPKAQGFRMPGEWEPHAGTWMAFPHDPHLWRAAARPAQQQLAAVARAVAQFEQVWMLVDPKVRWGRGCWWMLLGAGGVGGWGGGWVWVDGCWWMQVGWVGRSSSQQLWRHLSCVYSHQPMRRVAWVVAGAGGGAGGLPRRVGCGAGRGAH